MSQSPELAGGEGFTYEGYVAAFYLTALFAENYAPGIDDRIVVRVSVQQRDFGEPLDDVIVDFEDAAKNPARLSLQVKRSLTISSAITNTDFRDIIRDSWNTLKKPGFRVNIDRYGAAVGTISPAKERALKTLCDWARESLNSEHFDTRFAPDGSAGQEIKAVKADVLSILENVKGGNCSSEEQYQFLAHFVLIQFDFISEGAIAPSDAINRIKKCLAPIDATKAPLVWSRIVQLARASAGKSGQFDRARLVRIISNHARLAGSATFIPLFEKLAELAKSYANLISDDVGGTRIERTSLFKELDEKLTTARIVQVRGLPGSGKSVVVKRAVMRAFENGPVLFLKAEQLTGTSWLGFAVSHGLSDVSLEQLLVEVGAVGTPILFIDAIDRIEKERQPIILDLMRAIVDSPSLENWRIVVSLRDSGIELLRNWLGDILDALRVETLEVGSLSDEEAEILAKAKPHLRPLLYGTVQEIVRRPFFAKVLDKSYVADPTVPVFIPQSEVDLIVNWWRRGGYNASGQSALERQRTLRELAQLHARQLSQPIRISQISSVFHINDLMIDDILQNEREGISVRFAHDIFFEWAFFYVLEDCGSQWLEEIKSCGEPPAVARVVELASQSEYAKVRYWREYLSQTERSDIRSQWQRAWLAGPLGIAEFSGDEDQFAAAVFADDFRFCRKLLVWFQAEKTAPNEAILRGELLQENRQRIADLLGWPSDFAAWRRLINFILRRISVIPQRLYPEVVAIFDVWQNALSQMRNKTSHAILQQCATWLESIDKSSKAQGPDENSEYWSKVPERGAFRKSLVQLILRSSIAEPLFVEEYLQRVMALERISEDEFEDIIVYSPILAQSQPKLLVDLSLTFLKEKLPDERVARRKQKIQRETALRNEILSKPEEERTRQEKNYLSTGPSFPFYDDFNHFEWDRLAIQDDYRNFRPPSPLREPFHSLFHKAPDEALRLLRVLCNHAIMAWRQLHRYSQDQYRKPIPLELSFPWGIQRFWGTEREYLWFRSTWAPKAIGSGFMALEDWCFAELERSKSVDELIQAIVEGNECIAVLGIAAMLALHTETVSEVTLPLFTSQRLLAADFQRMGQDLSPTNLIGFMRQADIPHYEAVKAANDRPVRKKQLSWMVPSFIFASDSISERVSDAILNFKNNLPFQYEEERSIPGLRAHLLAEAIKYAEMADLKNYKAYRAEKDSDQIAIVHVSPSVSEPENAARYEKSTLYLKQSNLWAWASKFFEDKSLSSSHTMVEAIALARESDDRHLFEQSNEENDEYHLAMRRGAVAATAAIVLNLRDGLEQEDIEWARDVLDRAIRLPEKYDPLWLPEAIIPWHPSIYVARGLAADIRAGSTLQEAVYDLIGLIAHPLEVVSLAALEEACKLWSKDQKLTWAALNMAFSLCYIPPRPRDQIHQYHSPMHTASEMVEALERTLCFYEEESDWIALPLPPPAWVKAEPGAIRNMNYNYDEFDWNDSDETTEQWISSPTFWYSKYAAEILKRIPYDEILNSNAKRELLDFLAGVLDWTIQKIAPPWAMSNRRDSSASSNYELTHTLGSRLGHVAGLMPLADFKPRFLDPILKLEGDNCWALLSPFTRTYVCTYLYDALFVPIDTIATLELCLKHFLHDSAFNRESYRSGEFSGLHQPELVQILMFVSVERADLAARYVNGDWSEIDRILPLIDCFIRAGGWAASVMDPFLTLCERAKSHYPAEVFADQILFVIVNDFESLKGWHGSLIPARIAELVQYLAYRDAPMKLDLAQKFLRILDFLVDMGDRRSAALQLGESFREIRLTS